MRSRPMAQDARSSAEARNRAERLYRAPGHSSAPVCAPVQGVGGPLDTGVAITVPPPPDQEEPLAAKPAARR
jgi:hypothetical protein